MLTTEAKVYRSVLLTERRCRLWASVTSCECGYGSVTFPDGAERVIMLMLVERDDGAGQRRAGYLC